MIKIAICDDESIFLAEIEQLTNDFFNSKNIDYTIHIFESGEDLFANLEQKNQYDITLLDIQMGSISGIDIGEKLRCHFNHTKSILIYISSHKDLALEVIRYRPHRFISKPIEHSKLEEAFLSAVQMLEDQQNKIHIFKDNTEGQISVPLHQILYFEITERHRVDVITAHHRYQYYGTISDVIKKYEASGFLLIHKSIFVNFEYISKLSYETVQMSNGDVLSISGPKRKIVPKQYQDIRIRRELQ